jgi:GTP-binding protein
MEFGTNSSPLRGQDGKFVTARVIEDRLYEEVQRDVSLRYVRNPTPRLGSSPAAANFTSAF